MTARNRTAGVSDASGIGPKSTLEAISRAVPPSQPLSSPERTQTLVLEDFPQPATARALSPNGRAHWARKAAERGRVAGVMSLAMSMAGWEPVGGPVRVTFRWIFPTRGRRDLDNLSTGVTKACIDAMVRRGVLADDDSRHVVELKAEAVYEKGRRALEIRMEAA